MSVKFSGAGNRASYSNAGLTPGTGDYTLIYAVKMLTDVGRFSDFVGLTPSLNASSGYISGGTDTNGTDIQTFLESSHPTAYTAATTGVWYWVAMSRTGGTFHLRVFPDTNGNTTPTVDNTVADGVNWSAINLLVVGEIFSGEDPNAEFRSVRYWNATSLSNAQLGAEFDSATPVLTSGLYAAYSLVDTTTGFTDQSGNGRNLTNSGGVNGASNPARIGAAASAALTGTATASITEADIVAGGKTIILTLTGDTWVASGGTFDAQRQNIIDGMDSAQSEATGWDAVVKAGQGVSGVVRTSSTVVTITLDAFATYNITATETITVTIPGSAVTGGSPIVASPTFTVSATGGGGTVPLFTDHLIKLMGAA